MPGRDKTWTGLLSEIGETARKWKQQVPTITNSLTPRERKNRYQNLEERTVKLDWSFYDHLAGRNRAVTLSVRRADTAIDNLELVVKALEHIRMAESRGITMLLVLLYRQMYPAPAATPPPSTPPPVGSSGPYATLHIATTAPLAVAEAAYKALMRQYHPDVGGSTAQAQAINAAITAIRKEQAPG